MAAGTAKLFFVWVFVREGGVTQPSCSRVSLLGRGALGGGAFVRRVAAIALFGEKATGRRSANAQRKQNPAAQGAC